jgi:bifunctional non-homologous end joining protein LigD
MRPPSTLCWPTGFVEPCLPTLGRAVRDGPNWVHEVKHDGYRFICRRDGDRVRVISRNGIDWTDRVPSIVEALRSLRMHSAMIDGEGVICDERGVTDFDALRFALARRSAPEALLYAFDVLELDGQDLCREPWEARRKALASLLRKAGEGIRLSEHIESSCGQAIFRHACSMGLEGIVSKRRDAPYRSGRCADWIKVKNPNAPAATRIFE